MNTIALFGATGKTGRLLLKKLLERNFTVKVLVRSPEKLNLYLPNLVVNKGDVLNIADVFETIRDADAVISVIGHVKGCPPDLQTQAIKNILSAMNQEGIKRLIDLSGSGVKVPGDHPKLPDKILVFMMKNLLGKAIRDRFIDGENHVQLISQSDADWTVIRSPVILARLAKRRIEAGFVGSIPGFSITFDDLTEFILKTLEENSYIRQYPYVTNG
jgi:putative NADH-flavin reductase